MVDEVAMSSSFEKLSIISICFYWKNKRNHQDTGFLKHIPDTHTSGFMYKYSYKTGCIYFYACSWLCMKTCIFSPLVMDLSPVEFNDFLL